MHRYIVTMKHDTGTKNLIINASTKESAKEIACNTEKAPERAVVAIKQLS